MTDKPVAFNFFEFRPILIGGHAMQWYGLRYANKDIDFVVHPSDYKRLILQYPTETHSDFPPQIQGVKLKSTIGDRIAETDYFQSIYKYDYEYLLQRAVPELVDPVLVASKEDLIVLKAMTAYDEVNDPPPPPSVRKKSFKDMDLLVTSLANASRSTEIKKSPGEGKKDSEATRPQLAMRDHGTYDVGQLQKLTENFHMIKIPIDILEPVLDQALWEDADENEITPRSVLEDPKSASNSVHPKAIEKADLKYPILVTLDLEGNYDILDGLHRLAKAVKLHHKTIDAQIVTQEVLGQAKIDDAEMDLNGDDNEVDAVDAFIISNTI